MATDEGPERLKVFTIGHSNYPIEDFLQLLDKHNIDVLVDVRSAPYSKYSPQFNKESLKLSVANAGRKYLFLGRELGGKPKDADFYDEVGYTLYWKIAESPMFAQGIERLKKGVASYTVALMCGEEDPTHCHRRLLVSRVLRDQNIEVIHIRRDGVLQSDEDMDLANEETSQLSLFNDQITDRPWRSSNPRKLS